MAMKEGAIKKICKEVLTRVKPSECRRKEVLHLSENLTKELNERLRSLAITAEVEVEGSVAKDTWLAEEPDIDVFILLPRTYSKQIFLKVLDVAKALVGEKWRERYAEHPYIEAEVGGYTINFVPCFKISKIDEIVSSVDRTPLHKLYIKRNLTEVMKNEVRLLKKFMKGVEVYGAEIRVGGFSGYLCELLILNYKSFAETLKKVSGWKMGEVVDVENLYEGRLGEAKRLFDAPLIVVDPVDSNRNVSAAVSRERLGELIMSSRIFLEEPRLSFFYPSETKPLSTSSLRKRFSILEFDVVILVFKSEVMVPDVLWGQLYKSLRSLRRLLVNHDFQVLKASAWSDEEGTDVLLFGLESRFLPPTKRHAGPPFDSREANKFLAKHVDAETTVLGPWVEEGRWVVCVKRRYVDAVSLLQEKLKNGGRGVGVASKFIEAVKTSLEIQVNEEIIGFYSSNEEFAKLLTGFLSGRPRWLG